MHCNGYWIENRGERILLGVEKINKNRRGRRRWTRWHVANAWLIWSYLLKLPTTLQPPIRAETAGRWTSILGPWHTRLDCMLQKVDVWSPCRIYNKATLLALWMFDRALDRNEYDTKMRRNSECESLRRPTIWKWKFSCSIILSNVFSTEPHIFKISDIVDL